VWAAKPPAHIIGGCDENILFTRLWFVRLARGGLHGHIDRYSWAWLDSQPRFAHPDSEAANDDHDACANSYPDTATNQHADEHSNFDPDAQPYANARYYA
jgi:hypothetical protein